MWETTKIIWDSFRRSIIEVAFLFLPSVLYSLTMYLLGAGNQVFQLPGWSFVSFSMFALMARDSINAFRHRAEDKTNRSLAAIISICGLGVSGVLMTLSITRSQIAGFELPAYFDSIVLWSIIIAFFMAVVTKSILIQRDDYGRIVTNNDGVDS